MAVVVLRERIGISTRRAMNWLRILTRLVATKATTEIALIISALIDTLLSMSLSVKSKPKTYVSGIVYSKKYRVYFQVRAGSDDLFTVLPDREDDVNELILRSLREGDVFVDVGASIGYYSVLASKIVGHNGHVVSIEPVPETAEILKLNIELNDLKNVKVVPYAAWNERSHIRIYVPKSYYGYASAHADRYGSEIEFTVKDVPTIPLDELCKDLDSIKTIKIDIEGCEYQALLGAHKVLRKTKNLIIELTRNKDEVIYLLKENSFKVHKLKFGNHILCQKPNLFGGC